MMIYFYKITNLINNKVYIGQSNKEKDRWRQHKYFGRNPHWTKQYIHQAMNKYGIENFEYEVIATCKTNEDADEIESLLINQYNSRDKQFGYNVAPGGGSGWNRGLPSEQQPMYGKKQSEYFLKRISEANSKKKGPHSEDHKKKISKSLKGKMSGERHPMFGKFGDRNPNSNLDWDIVNKIRNDYENFDIPQNKLVEKYKISKAQISLIVNYKTWKSQY